MRCFEERKLDLVTYMLQKGAEDWCKLVENKGIGTEPLKRIDFKKAFQEKYYP